jgi:hypothetical protein
MLLVRFVRSGMLAGLFLGGFVLSSYAGRPFVTDDVGTVVKDSFDLEPSINYGGNFALGGLSFKHGLTDRADIEFGLGYQALPDDERMPTTASFMCKFAIIPDIFAATLGMTFGNTAYSLNLIASKTIGSFSGDVNVGYTTQADINDADVTYGLDVAYTYKRLGIGAEVFGTQEMANWQFGLRFTITDWFIIDSGVGTTIEPKPVLQATSGAAFTF